MPPCRVVMAKLLSGSCSLAMRVGEGGNQLGARSPRGGSILLGAPLLLHRDFVPSENVCCLPSWGLETSQGPSVPPWEGQTRRRGEDALVLSSWECVSLSFSIFFCHLWDILNQKGVGFACLQFRKDCGCEPAAFFVIAKATGARGMNTLPLLAFAG